MAKFIYRMQNVLDIKYKLEEQAKQHYMSVRARLNEAQDYMDLLENRHQGYMNEYIQLVSANLDVLEIENCKNSILLVESYMVEQQIVISQIENELEEAIFAMNEAVKERKIHEKLKENQFEAFKQELNQEEMKEIDQLVSYQYNGQTGEDA